MSTDNYALVLGISEERFDQIFEQVENIFRLDLTASEIVERSSQIAQNENEKVAVGICIGTHFTADSMEKEFMKRIVEGSARWAVSVFSGRNTKLRVKAVSGFEMEEIINSTNKKD